MKRTLLALILGTLAVGVVGCASEPKEEEFKLDPGKESTIKADTADKTQPAAATD